MRRIILIAMSSIVLVAGSRAATNIDPVHKYGWGENIGWTNWRDANGGTQGVHVGQDILSGYIWGENVGWVDVGDGTPTAPPYYANVDDTDYGVNIDAADDLYGLGWGENIGWVNFDTRTELGPFGQQARYDRVTYRFHGYAWGENVGWLNLDDATHYVAREILPCQCGDIDMSGGLIDLNDFATFALCYGLMGPAPGCDAQAFFCADLDSNGTVDLNDFATFAIWFGATTTKTVPGC
jgi:hypothetical protein